MKPEKKTNITPKIEKAGKNQLFIEPIVRAQFLMSRHNIVEARKASQTRKAFWSTVLVFLVIGATTITVLTFCHQ